MKRLIVLPALISSLLMPAVVYGQAQNSAKAKDVTTTTPADIEFFAVQAAAIPVETPDLAAGKTLSRDEFNRARKLQSAGFLAAAARAKDFYTKYPAHEKAGAARAIEAISTLRAVQTGAVELEPAALRLAQDFRADGKNPSADRYHVATTVAQIEISKKGLKGADLLAEYEQRAKDLYGEFPDEPAVYDMFLGVARNADAVQARRVAQQVLTMPAPDSAKEEARAVIDRQDMPGKLLTLDWQDENGKLKRMADYRGKVVVFYLWSTWSSASISGVEKLAAGLKSDVTLVSVNVDTDQEKGKGAKGTVPSSNGNSYFDARGLAGPLPKQLRATKVPAVFVIDANGVFVGTGSPSDLPGLLAKAGK